MAIQTSGEKHPGGPITWHRSKGTSKLRIGIVQGGRIIEERLIRKARETSPIGWSSQGDLCGSLRGACPQWLLFEITPKGYVARFADAMDARIAVGNEVISLAQLKQAGRIRQTGKRHSAPAAR